MPTGHREPYEYSGTPGERPSPLQNRVLPDGRIVAVPDRGFLTGNRGCLHGPDRRLGTSRWRSRLWISCTLDWQGRRRDVMPPGRWTALFFLDEVTALAAGHRPCGYCRRPDHLAFAAAWANAARSARPPSAAAMDARLHAERVDRLRRQVTRTMSVVDLPDGTMVRYAGAPHLVVAGGLRPWSWSGYGEGVDLPGGAVEVLTAPAVLRALRGGYRPLVHPSVTSHALRPLP